MTDTNLENPYFEEFRDSNHRSPMLFSDFKRRGQMVSKYAWAIPNEEVIRSFAEFSPIVEIGAGNGYWAHMLTQAGAEVLAFDIQPPLPGHDNIYFKGNERLWFDVQVGDHDKILEYPSHTPLMVWPEYDGPQALKFLSCLSDRYTFLYVGERARGCCGCDKFWDRLDELGWDSDETHYLPKHEGLHDCAIIFTR